jgi:hypothetical protein
MVVTSLLFGLVIVVPIVALSTFAVTGLVALSNQPLKV